MFEGLDWGDWGEGEDGGDEGDGEGGRRRGERAVVYGSVEAVGEGVLRRRRRMLCGILFCGTGEDVELFWIDVELDCVWLRAAYRMPSFIDGWLFFYHGRYPAAWMTSAVSPPSPSF